MNTIILLGAGASVDAGLPMTVELTRRLERWLAERPRETCGHPLQVAEWRTFNHLVRLIIDNEVESGGSVFGPIDVERIITALDVLAYRDSHEVSAFVETWADVPSALGEVNVFEQLKRSLLFGVRTIMTQVEPYRFDYFAPMFQNSAPVRLATLNFDLGVEMAAAHSGVRLDTGFESWDGTLEWRWDDAADGARLLKLHGCIDHCFPRMNEGLTMVPRVKVFDAETGEAPGIILGSGNKLRIDGPFLPMLLEFQRWLNSAAHLIVCGYSMRDDHINHLLINWLTVTGRKLTVIDPGFPMHSLRLEGALDLGPDPVQRLDPGHSVLQEWLLEYEHAGGRPRFPLEWRESMPEVRILRMGAREGLPQALATS